MALNFSLSEELSSFGHHFIIGLSGEKLSETDRLNLTELKPIGIVLFKRNIGTESNWQDGLTSLLLEVKEIVGREELLVAIDHEGGSVNRLPSPITHFPPPKEYAPNAREVAITMCNELAPLGINLLLGPVADILWNPRNLTIGNRAFGTTSDDVTIAACNFTLGVMECGLIPCPKHFPGIGGIEHDPHNTLPKLNRTIEELRDRDLKPFASLIDLNIPCIMSSHVLFSGIDRDFPATISKKILNDILRQQLGFGGVLISDDLDMKAITSSFPDAEVMKAGLNAGCDIFLVGKEADRAIYLAQFIYEALKARLIDERTMKRSFDRISSLFSRLGPAGL